MNLNQIIVCHRGYHGPDQDLSRPVENSLSAYEEAWRYFRFCECDITTSLDGTLYLCHDESFARVADASSEYAAAPVHQITEEQVDTIVLLDGTRPTKLVHVLEVAKRLNESITDETLKKQLVVELKRDDAHENVVKQLTLLMDSRLDLAECIAVVMSFDLDMMKRMAGWRRDHAERLRPIDAVKFMFLTSLAKQGKDRDDPGVSSITRDDFPTRLVNVLRENDLDGVYLEYQKEMTWPPLSQEVLSAQQKLKKLTEEVYVGVWNRGGRAHAMDDGLKTFPQLTKLGMTFVNSDLPAEEMFSLGLDQMNEGVDGSEPDCVDPTLLKYLMCYYGRE